MQIACPVLTWQAILFYCSPARLRNAETSKIKDLMPFLSQ